MNSNSILQTGTIGAVSSLWSVVGQRDFAGTVRHRRMASRPFLARHFRGRRSVADEGVSLQSVNTLSPAPTSWSVVATGDFNYDGMGDFLWEDNQSNLGIWFMNGTHVTPASRGKLPANWVVVGADMGGWVFCVTRPPTRSASG